MPGGCHNPAVSFSRWRGVALGFVLVLAAVGYAALPSQPASATPRGVVYGHVPTAAAITSATIVIPRNAQVVGYKTKVVTISQGGKLNVVNLDRIEHTVTSVATGSNGAAVLPPREARLDRIHPDREQAGRLVPTSSSAPSIRTSCGAR